jgi:hypothetical protein
LTRILGRHSCVTELCIEEDIKSSSQEKSNDISVPTSDPFIYATEEVALQPDGSPVVTDYKLFRTEKKAIEYTEHLVISFGRISHVTKKIFQEDLNEINERKTQLRESIKQKLTSDELEYLGMK